MLQTLVFGLVASSALVLGALVGARVRIPGRVLAAMLAFASGALLSALSFELFGVSYESGGIWRAATGLLVGALVFTLISQRLDRWAATGRTAGFALLAAVTLDGVPENIALGVSLSAGTGGLALLGAIIVSNFPEAIVGSASMRGQGRSVRFVLLTWTMCALLLVAAVVLGAGPLSTLSGDAISLALAFAAGAVLASLADTLMPQAYEQGGPTVALSTAAGFVLSFVLATL